MGYTHYWYRQRALARESYDGIVRDFHVLLPALQRWGIELAGALGNGEPHISDTEVSFNGKRHCGHPRDYSIHIAWPAEGGQGVAAPGEDAKTGTWYAGALLSKRACDGDCSHETFHFPLVLELQEWDKPKRGLYFAFCKTAFKPYDLAVSAFLVVAKHYLADKLVVRSDGGEAQWQDGRWLCQLELGYGLDFNLDPES